MVPQFRSAVGATIGILADETYELAAKTERDDTCSRIHVPGSLADDEPAPVSLDRSLGYRHHVTGTQSRIRPRKVRQERETVVVDDAELSEDIVMRHAHRRQPIWELSQWPGSEQTFGVPLRYSQKTSQRCFSTKWTGEEHV